MMPSYTTVIRDESDPICWLVQNTQPSQPITWLTLTRLNQEQQKQP